MSEEINSKVSTGPNEEPKAERAQVNKKMTGKWIGIIGGVLVILIALIVGIGIYNTPANRLARLLDLGYRYLEEGNYEQAALTFDKAIAIDDRCIEAYAGGIKSYQGLGDEEGLIDIYERALAVTLVLEDDELAESMDTAVEIYLAANDVYSDNPGKVVQVLEDGLESTADDRIEDSLIENYLELAEDYMDEDNYVKALEIYDRLLELGVGNDEIPGLAACLQEYLDLLMVQGRVDEIRRLMEKYQDKVPDVDFQTILARSEFQENSEQPLEEEQGDETNDADKQETNDGIEGQTDLAVGGTWVDDLYQKMVAGDAEAVYSIISSSDFVTKCSAYEHRLNEEWMHMMYMLYTSDNKFIGVAKDYYDDTTISVYHCIHYSDWQDHVEMGDYFYQLIFGGTISEVRIYVIENVRYDSFGDSYVLSPGEYTNVYFY